MRGLTKAAAFLLAPALARASSMSLDKSWTVVNLDIPPGNHDVDSLALRLNIQETDEICGPTRLLVNGHYLEQNEDGFGSGVVPVGEDILMTAHWLFSCVTSNNGPAAKLLRFTIDKLDGEPTSDIDFAMTFRQTSPAIVLELGGAAVTEPWVPIESAVEQHPAEEMPDPDDELEAQMHELEILRAQVDDLMELIHAKEMIIRERLGNQGDHGPPPPPPPPPIFIMLQDCNSVQCVVRALTDKVKHTAGHFYGGFFKPGHGPPPQHESEYGWGVSGGREPYRGDGGHHKPPGFPGNHSRPFPPPPPPPPFCPPCDGPPPPPPPPPPPHHGPPPEDGERPPLHDGDRPVPPDHDDDLPPPPEDGEHSHLPGHGDDSPPPDHPPHAPVDEFPPPPPHHGDHGPPEHGEQPHPPHGEPPFDGPHDGKPGDNDFGVHHPPMESEMDEQPSPPDHEGHPPPPPHRHGPHGHGPHGPGGHHHPPPPPVFMSFGVAAIALALFSVIGLGYIHRRANRLNPESRHALHRSSGNQRSRRSPLQKAIRRVLARWTGEYDEEKQAMLRHRSDSEDSVTMEQEIARFREAAFMVEGLVAAEEGRTHRGMVHPAPPHHFYQYHHPHPHPHGPPPHGPPPHGPPPGLPPRGPPPPPGPPSPPGPPPPPRPPMIPEDAAPTEYPDFVTGNERLPSYDDETHDASVVSDGCRSMPGSADYSPSTTASTTSDLLGDSKH